MITFKDYITEKINKKEFEDVIDNLNILAGCEFEFYMNDVDPIEDEELVDLAFKADQEVEQTRNDIDDYYNELTSKLDSNKEEIDSLNKEIEDIDGKIGRIDKILDELKEYVSIISLKSDDDKSDTIDELEDEKTELQDQRNQLEDQITDLENWDDSELLDQYTPIPNSYSMSYYFELIEELSARGVNTRGFERRSNFDEQCFYWFESQEVPTVEELLGIDIREIQGANGEISADTVMDQGFPFNVHKHGWDVKEDGSLGENGVEIVTPILTIKELIETIEKVFPWISNVGYTDGSCGFHVHMSVKTHNEIDPLKLILFAEEELIYKYFEDRRRNSYAENIKSGHIDPLGQISMDDMIRVLQKSKIDKEFNTQKYLGIHLIELEKNHVEFRYMGGYEYHKKFKEVKDLIVNYGHWLSIACDPQYKRKEYIKKLNRLTNTFNRIYVKAVVEQIEYYIEYIEKMAGVDENKKNDALKKLKRRLKPYKDKLKTMPNTKSYGISGEDVQKEAVGKIDSLVAPIMYDLVKR